MTMSADENLNDLLILNLKGSANIKRIGLGMLPQCYDCSMFEAGLVSAYHGDG